MKITKRQLKKIIKEEYSRLKQQGLITETRMSSGRLIVSQVNQLKQAYFILDPERNYDRQSIIEQQKVVERLKSEMNPRDFKIASRMADIYVEYLGTDFGGGGRMTPYEEALFDEAEALGSKIGVSAQVLFR
tara:strand:+ start:27486 stop:27881 length:396 start_codon:yes stop_codon:yes gene_type:complete